MKLIVVGAGQGGSNIADAFVGLGKWVYNNRGRIRIFSGKGRNPPIGRGVFAVNLADKDLRGMEHISPREGSSILLGTTDEFRGRGAGKVNTDGAEQARRGLKKIIDTIRDNSDVAGADAFLVIGTTAGGTGSGAVGVIVDGLKEAFPTKPVYAMLVLPIAKEYTDPDSMVNTATCLKRVIEDSQADGVFLIDNQELIKGDRPSGDSLAEVNRKIADSFMDILCVGEETERRYIGEMLDANDMIRNMGGIIAIGLDHETVPKSPLFGRLFNRGTPDIREATERNNRVRNVVENALRNLSVRCGSGEGGVIRYNAGKVLCLLSGPREEITEEVLEMADGIMSDHVPGAGRKKGTYPGRTSDSISATVILSDIGEGAVMDLMKGFYIKGTAMKGEVEAKRNASRAKWEEISQEGSELPKL